MLIYDIPFFNNSKYRSTCSNNNYHHSQILIILTINSNVVWLYVQKQPWHNVHCRQLLHKLLCSIRQIHLINLRFTLLYASWAIIASVLIFLNIRHSHQTAQWTNMDSEKVRYHKCPLPQETWNTMTDNTISLHLSEP